MNPPFLSAALVFVSLTSTASFAAEPLKLTTSTQLSAPAEVWRNVEFKDGGFESEPGASPWRFSQHAGVKAYRFTRSRDEKTEGQQSLRVERTAEQVFGSVVQSIEKLEPGDYRLSADLKSLDVTAKGWSVKVTSFDANGAFEVADSTALVGTQPWQRVSVLFTVSPTVTSVMIGASLRGGGTAWIDNVLLERKR